MKQTVNIRFFLALLFFSITVSIASEANNASYADTLLFNGNIISVDPRQSRYSALAIRGEKIVALGNKQQLQHLITDDTLLIDLAHRTLLPGFIDQHNHIFEGASDIGGNCELSPELAMPEQSSLINECKQNAGSSGSWVIGYGFQLDTFTDHDSAMTPLAWLDLHFPDHPVVIMEESSHAMIVNTRAFELANLSESLLESSGGRIMKDSSGTANGILFDNAGDQVMEMAWNAQSNRKQESYSGLLAGIKEATENGITTVGDGRMYWRRGWYEIWQKAHRNNNLTLRVSLRPWIYPELDKSRQLNFLKSIQSNNKHGDLLVNQVKIYVDGVLHFGTAKVDAPYKWSWQKDLPNGLNYIAPSALNTWLSELDKIGYGAHIHAIGDKGIREALNAISKQRKQQSRQLYGLTHLEMLSTADIPRFKALEVTGDFQAGASFFAEHDWAIPYIGAIRAKALMPMRELFESGANITFSSDWTVNSLNPLVAIANSFRHQRQNGLPTTMDAIEAHTINAARALGVDSVTGSIEIGKYADLVVLENDITRLSGSRITQTPILMTFYKGEIVFERD